ncbi:hypothetical protein VKT23_010741 [Stygiomarasmius scandens]|uniref:Uncharacterized protein n=1 Tax=Marasmiellus scandens TaxID=2682957 RepID=A0ABR1JBT5_9AGAR
MNGFLPSIAVDDAVLIIANAIELLEFSDDWSSLSDTGLSFDNTSHLVHGNQSTTSMVNLTFTGVFHLQSVVLWVILYYSIGTSATIFGNYNCLPDLTNCPYQATLDGQVSFLNPSSRTILYQSPTDLSEGSHQVSIFLGFNQSDFDAMVDYALVQPGQDTLLNGAVGGFPDMTRPPERLHVDHNNPAVTFNGQWKPSTDGTTRDSITVGDSVQFPFYGDDIVVYGSLDAGPGSITLNVSLDGRNPSSVTTPSDPPNAIPFFSYFQTDLLPGLGFPGANHSTEQNHTINIVVADVSGAQTFSFSAFEFLPNFRTLNTMPPLPDLSNQSSTTATTTSTSAPVGSTSAAGGGGSSDGISGGAIASAMVGSIVAVTLLFGAGFFLWKRRKSKKPDAAANGREREDEGNVTPSMTRSPNSISPFNKRYIDGLDAEPFTFEAGTTRLSDRNGITPFTKTYGSALETSPSGRVSSSVSPFTKTYDGMGPPAGAASPSVPGASSTSLSPYTKTYAPVVAEQTRLNPDTTNSPSQQRVFPSNRSPASPRSQPQSVPPSSYADIDPPPPLSPTNDEHPQYRTMASSEEDHGNDDGHGEAAPRGGYPTRRRMMQMIERLNYQVQALSGSQRPPAYES